MGHVFGAVVADVRRVVDGDTIDVVLDPGYHVTIAARLRLLGIQAPERRTQEGVEAARYLASVLAMKRLRVVTEKSPEKYGRWLATVYAAPLEAPDAEVNVNDEMVRAGHAVAWDGKGPRP